MGQTATMRIAGDGDGKSLSRRVNFTVRSIQDSSCSPGKGRIWIYDTKQAGLCLMVTATGKKNFYLYRKVSGRPQRIRLGAFPEIGVEQARNLASRHAGSIAKGENPMAAKREARVQGMNLGQLWDWFLESWAKPRKRSWHDDELRYNGHLKAWASRRLSDITLADVSSLHRKVAKATSGATANRVLALLSTMFNKGRQIGWTQPNPCKGVEKFAETSRERFLSADELPRFMAALDADETHPDWRDYFKIALLTGARRSNVLSMRWEELDLDAARWNVSAAKSKNKAAMPIALSSHVVEILRRRKNAGEWVFPSFGPTGHLTSPDEPWRILCERAKVSGVRIHDLRRTFGSWQAAAGSSLAIIGKTLGHKSVQATAIYARMNLDPVRESVNAVTAAIVAAAGKTAKVE